MPTNMPGGKLISGMGGYTNIISPYNGTMTHLDVARWEILLRQKLFRKGHSGTLGAIATRVVAQDWRAVLDIWWDIGNDPLSTMGSSWGCGVQFGMSSLSSYQMYGYSAQGFWLAPSAILESLVVTDSSEGNDDGIVTARAEIVANGLLFDMPAALTAYNTYVTQLQALGQFTGLATFTTMQ